MATKVLLFAYGTLQPGRLPPRSLSQWWPDRVKGRLFDLGAYPGVVDVGTAADWIEGATLEIDADELPLLDAYEDLDSGEFRRRVVTTERGFDAWIYEYAWPVPQGAAWLTRWP